MSHFPFDFKPEERAHPVYHHLRFTWKLAEHYVDTDGLDIMLLVTRSSDYPGRRLPAYEPRTGILVIDAVSGWKVTLSHLIEGLSQHITRGKLRGGTPDSVSIWKAAAADWREEHHKAMEAFAREQAGLTEPAKRKAAASQAKRKKQGVGRGNWTRPNSHPLHCSALKSGYLPCQAMRVKGTAFCYQHQGWKSNLSTLDDILYDLEDSGWSDLVQGGPDNPATDEDGE